MSDTDRLELLTLALQETSRTVAHQAGELQAMFVVLHGLLAFEGLTSVTRDKLQLVLERCAAANLNQSVSDEFLRGFLSRVELLRSSLQKAGDHSDSRLLI